MRNDANRCLVFTHFQSQRTKDHPLIRVFKNAGLEFVEDMKSLNEQLLENHGLRAIVVYENPPVACTRSVENGHEIAEVIDTWLRFWPSTR